jgi:magnesium chelatase accessory protein
MGPATPKAPVVWLLHGTGASTHSWRTLMPLLAPGYRVLAADLPGHAFTAMPEAGAQLSLPGMARALCSLMRTLDLAPDLLVGHSAGAAVAVRMCLDALVAPRAVISINGALLPLGGLAGQFFSPVAKLMASAPIVPRLFAWHASDPAVLQRLIAGTGSKLDPAGECLYARLVRNPGHAAAALAMMARWDLPSLARDLARLRIPLCLAVGSNDRTIPPSQALHVQALLPPHPATRVATLAGLGHLAHEERPDLVAALVNRVARESGLAGPDQTAQG